MGQPGFAQQGRAVLQCQGLALLQGAGQVARQGQCVGGGGGGAPCSAPSRGGRYRALGTGCRGRIRSRGVRRARSRSRRRWPRAGRALPLRGRARPPGPAGSGSGHGCGYPARRRTAAARGRRPVSCAAFSPETLILRCQRSLEPGAHRLRQPSAYIAKIQYLILNIGVQLLLVPRHR